jgi:membrane-associated phospholipid phosphatase
MLLWASAAFLLIGLLCLFIDRRAAARFREESGWHVWFFLRTTDFAKGLHWILLAVLAYGAAQAWIALLGENMPVRRFSDLSLCLLTMVLIASVFLHTAKLLLGRRRPRDDHQHGLYGLKPFAFDAQYDSFPSGHAMTIFCVAVVASSAVPVLAPLWFLLAFYLSLTRAFLTAHFLSDVCIGAALGLFIARETILILFPALALSWF